MPIGRGEVLHPPRSGRLWFEEPAGEKIAKSESADVEVSAKLGLTPLEASLEQSLLVTQNRPIFMWLLTGLTFSVTCSRIVCSLKTYAFW